MSMMEYYNGLESNEFSEGIEKKTFVTEAEKAYISEVLGTKDSTAIVARIDVSILFSALTHIIHNPTFAP